MSDYVMCHFNTDANKLKHLELCGRTTTTLTNMLEFHRLDAFQLNNVPVHKFALRP